MAKEYYEPSKEELKGEIKSLQDGRIDYISPDEFKSAKQKGLRRALSRLEVSTRGARYKAGEAVKSEVGGALKPSSAGKGAFSLGTVLTKAAKDFYDSIPPEGMSQAQWKRELARRRRKAKKKRR